MEIPRRLGGFGQSPIGNIRSSNLGHGTDKYNSILAHYSGLEVSTANQGLQVALSDLPQRAVGREEKQALPYFDYKDLPSPPPEPKYRYPLWKRKAFRIVLAIVTILIVAVATTVPIIAILRRRRDTSPVSNPSGVLFTPLTTAATMGSIVSMSSTATRGSTTSMKSATSLSSTVSLTATASTTPTATKSATLTPIPTSVSSRILSTSGAFNGTAMATLDPSNGIDRLLLFYQYYTGELYHNVLSNQGTWQGPQSFGVQDAMNGTPITTASYVIGDTALWIIFYVDKSGMIQNTCHTNSTSNWTKDCKHVDHLIQVPKTPDIAFSVGYTPQWNIYNSTGASYSLLSLYVGGDDGLVHEYFYDDQNSGTTWDPGFTFPDSNGFAGASLTSRGNLSTMHLVNDKGELELWWKDSNIQSTNTTSYPIGIWNKGVNSGNGIYPNTTMCADGNVFYQDPSNHIIGFPWTGTVNTQRWGDAFDISNASVLPGTSIGCHFFYPPSDNSYYVYYQTNGSDIMQAVRTWKDEANLILGFWSTGSVPIG